MEICNAPSICLCVYLVVTCCHALNDEPTCLSKYDFEERFLEKIVRNEHKMELFENNIKSIVDKYKTEQQASMFDSKQAAIQQVIDEFKDNNLEMKAKLAAIKANNELMVQDAMVREARHNKVLNTTLEKAVSDIAGRRKHPVIAFQARGEPSNNPSDGKRLVFPTVLLNLGDGYDPTTGIFTAPVPGIYIFNVQLSLERNKWIDVQILHNGNIINAFVTGDDTYHTSNAGFGVTALDIGDRVEVLKFAGSSTALSRSEIKRWNMLTGALVIETTK